MKKYYIVFNILSFVIVFTMISACIQREETESITSRQIEVPSLQESIPAFQDEALKWNSDAYLVQAWVYLDNGFNVVSAAFRSPSEDSTSILISLNNDGSLTSRIVEWEDSVTQIEPLDLKDWPIDSQPALDIMLNEEGKRFLNSSQDHCSFLTLTRDFPRPNQPIVWRLTLKGCLSTSSDTQFSRIELDALTGEILPDESEN